MDPEQQDPQSTGIAKWLIPRTQIDVTVDKSELRQPADLTCTLKGDTYQSALSCQHCQDFVRRSAKELARTDEEGSFLFFCHYVTLGRCEY